MGQLTGAIRPTMRDVRMHPWRSLAAIVLITLPVAFLSYSSVFSTSELQFQMSQNEQISARYYGGNCEQDYSGEAYSCTNGVATSSSAVPPAAGTDRFDLLPTPSDSSEKSTATTEVPETISLSQVTELLGSDFHVEVIIENPAVFGFNGKHSTGNLTQLSNMQLLPGAPEFRPGEIVLGKYDATKLGAEVGSEIEVVVDIDGDERTSHADKINKLTVATIVPGTNSFVVQPTLISSDEIPNYSDPLFLLDSDRDISWDEVKKLNQAGVVVESWSFIDNPQTLSVDQMYPKYQEDLRAAQQYQPTYDNLYGIFDIVAFTVFYGISSAMILFLISPVFAIATSRQTKVYALMRTQGATKNHIRLAVIAYGTIAGLLGATVGTALGTVGGYLHWISSYPEWPVTFDFPDTLSRFALAVIGSTVAAFLPAFLSAKGSIMAGVAGAQPDRLRRWRKWMAVGPVGLTISAVLWTSYSIASRLGIAGNTDWYTPFESTGLLLLALLSFVSLFLSVPALIFSAGAVNRPLSVRIAGRLVRRQALKSTSIVLAMIGITFTLSVSNVYFEADRSLQTANNTELYNSHLFVVNPTVFPTDSSDAKTNKTEFPASEFEQQQQSAATPHMAEAINQISTMTDIAQSFPVYTVENEDEVTDIILKNECTAEADSNDKSSITYMYRGKDASTDPEAAAHCLYLMKQYRTIDYGRIAFDNILVGGPELLELFNLDPELKQQAIGVLNDGGIIGSSSIAATGPQQISVQLNSIDEQTAERNLTVPFVAALPENASQWILSPKAAAEANLTLELSGYGVIAANKPTYSQAVEIGDSIHNSFKDTVSVSSLVTTDYDADYVFTLVLAAVLLLVLGLVLVLSAEQVKRQNEQLYALGASPSLIRTIGALYTATLAFLGTVPALILGHIAALWFLEPSQTNINGQVLVPGAFDHYSPYWVDIVVLGIAVPLVAAIMGFFATRSHNLLSYRQD